MKKTLKIKLLSIGTLIASSIVDRMKPFSFNEDVMKKLLLATAMLAASSAANAGVVSAAGGLSWEVDGGLPNFSATIDFTQWWTVSNTTTISDTNQAVSSASISPTFSSLIGSIQSGQAPELVGAGKFNLNQGGIGEPSCNGCELTFSFGGLFFDPANQAAPIDSSTGWLNIYVDYAKVGGAFDEGMMTNAVDVADHASRAVDGELWLSLGLSDFIYNADPSYASLGEPLLSGTTLFYGDVVGGIAQNNFISDFFESAFEADAFGLTSIFDDNSRAPQSSADLNVSNYSVRGNGNVEAATVSAPSTIAMFGLALVGLGISTRRRKA